MNRHLITCTISTLISLVIVSGQDADFSKTKLKAEAGDMDAIGKKEKGTE